MIFFRNIFKQFSGRSRILFEISDDLKISKNYQVMSFIHRFTMKKSNDHLFKKRSQSKIFQFEVHYLTAINMINEKHFLF